MANVYDQLAQGVAFWNHYRQAKPDLQVELWDLELSEADWSGINLSGAKLPLFIAVNANLRGSDFSEADLHEAILRGADLSGANLSGANLWKADLSGANLSGANLWKANLSKANLSGTNLSRADLSEATLHGTILNDGIHGEVQFPEATA